MQFPTGVYSQWWRTVSLQGCGKVNSPKRPRLVGKCSDGRLGAVVQHVATQFALETSDLTNTSREKEIVRARQLAMWCCRRLVPQPSLPTIGRAFNRHHASIVEAVQVAERLIQRYPALADVVRAWERSWSRPSA
jgi:Bacterial dnaA protein helix-turn-helix